MTSVAIFAIVFQAYSKNKVIQRDTIKRTNETLLYEYIYYIYLPSLPMSSSVACCATTQNLITNCSFTEAGTM